jgi:hypothetical protein
MQSALIVRITSKLLSLIMGSMAVFCLYYAGQMPDYNYVWYLLTKTLEYGGCAAVIVYCQGRYLDQ